MVVDSESASGQGAHPADLNRDTAQISVSCYGCHAVLEASADEASYSCPSCQAVFALTFCPNCNSLVNLSEALVGHSLACDSCGKMNHWPEWAKHPASVAQYADVLAKQGRLLFAITGPTIASEGFAPLRPRIGAKVEFWTNSISIAALVQGGTYQPVAVVQLGEVRLLDVAGRGAMSSTTTRGGGAVGSTAKMAAFTTVPGAWLLAPAVDKASRKTTTVVETTLHLNAGARELMMQTSQVTPQVLHARLAPVITRIEELQAKPIPDLPTPAAAPPSLPDELRKLAALHEEGILSDDEFAAAKARLLSGA